MIRLTFFFLLFTSVVFSQSIKGVVFDKKSNEPLENVNIYFGKTKEGTITNEKGKFYIRYRSKVNKKDTVYFSHIGYKTLGLPVLELKSNRQTVYLIQDSEKLNEIRITSNKKLKSKIDFTKLASLKYPLYAFGSIIIDNNIYIIGGDRSYETKTYQQVILDNPDLQFPGTTMSQVFKKVATQQRSSWKGYNQNLIIFDTKSNLLKMPNTTFRKRAYHNLNYYNNKIYVLGGKRLSTNKRYEYLENKIEIYDLKNNAIIVDDTNPHQAIDFMSFSYNHHLILMGGAIKIRSNGTKEYSKKIHSFNLKTGYWYELEDMPVAKKTKGVLINDKIYLIGGYNKKALVGIETFDLISGKWKKEGNLFDPVDQHSITSNGNIIYIFKYNKLYTYDTGINELNEYSINLPLKSSKLHFINDKLYIIGGYIEESFSRVPSSGIYSIDINEFEKTKINRSKTLLSLVE